MNTRPSLTYCDDGNLNSNDGCSATCQTEVGFTCSGGSSTWKDTCDEICGDGLNFGYLPCDDGNLIDGDGYVLCFLNLLVALLSVPLNQDTIAVEVVLLRLIPALIYVGMVW